MRAFKDNAGRKWEIHVSVASGRRVRALTEFDLFKAIEGGPATLGALIEDVGTFAAVLFALVKPQAEAAAVTDEAFDEALGGDSLGDAADSFVEAVADFYRDPAKRKTLRDAWAKMKQLHQVLAGRAAKLLDGMNLDRMADGLLAESSSGATTSPVPSGSTPGR